MLETHTPLLKQQVPAHCLAPQQMRLIAPCLRDTFQGALVTVHHKRLRLAAELLHANLQDARYYVTNLISP